MKYALNIADDGRILSATFPQYAPEDAVFVYVLPEGDITHYKYIDGEIIKRTDEEISADNGAIEVVDEAPSQLDILEAQVIYTAMMTDTLLEV